jgi:hypothetical protein
LFSFHLAEERAAAGFWIVGAAKLVSGRPVPQEKSGEEADARGDGGAAKGTAFQGGRYLSKVHPSSFLPLLEGQGDAFY